MLERIPANDAHALRSQIQSLEDQLRSLKCALAAVEDSTLPEPNERCETQPRSTKWPLESDEYRRYGRQMILPQVGLAGQLKLRSASILIVGLGGLGCPAAIYLAGAGCGKLGLVDGDRVELSNLHRQVLHTTDGIGQLKVESARAGLYKLNPNVQCTAYPDHLTSTTAVDIMSEYDLVLDCTDHPASRYLISDAAVVAGKPLVSASALQTEGQLLILNYPPSNFDNSASGPCYRCIFPKPPPPESVLSCGEGGVLGPVVGVMGVLMALEAIKIVTAQGDHAGEALADQAKDESIHVPPMLIFSASGSSPFRSVRLRGRRPNCLACSDTSSITRDSLLAGTPSYTQFCGLAKHVAALPLEERVTAKELDSILQRGEKPIIIDVRDAVQFELCRLVMSINIPYAEFSSMEPFPPAASEGANPSENIALQTMSETFRSYPDGTPIYFICRLGNDSQLAVQKMKELNHPIIADRVIRDVQGGFNSWRQQVDSSWPEY